MERLLEQVFLSGEWELVPSDPLTDLMEIMGEPEAGSGHIWKQRQLPLATEYNQSCQ